MKTVKIAYVLLILSLIAVIANSVALNFIISDTISDIENSEDDPQSAYIQFNLIYEDFKRKTNFINLTVNHEDITDVESAFAEIIGAAKAGDSDAIITIKSRLRNSLEHLKRLTGINVDSILWKFYLYSDISDLNAFSLTIE